jgi:hypothetical protein
MGWKAVGVGWADDSSTGTLVELERDLALRDMQGMLQ